MQITLLSYEESQLNRDSDFFLIFFYLFIYFFYFYFFFVSEGNLYRLYLNISTTRVFQSALMFRNAVILVELLY